MTEQTASQQIRSIVRPIEAMGLAQDAIVGLLGIAASIAYDHAERRTEAEHARDAAASFLIACRIINDCADEVRAILLMPNP